MNRYNRASRPQVHHIGFRHPLFFYGNLIIYVYHEPTYE